VYAITPAGRRALADWLRTDSEGMLLESDHLVKLFFADHGRTQDALATIADLRLWAAEQLEVFAESADAYLAGDGGFPERMPVNVVTARFLVDFYATVANWTEWAEGVMAAWPDDPRRAEADWALMKDLKSRAERGAPGTAVRS
jgi:hypothetical protein